MAGLKEEIKQNKPFATLEEEVYLNIQRTADVLQWDMVAALKPFELTPAQYNVLRILRGAGEDGLMCGEIGERMISRDSDITRLLARLEKRRLISRQRDAKDRRVINSYITEEGLKILTELEDLTVSASGKRLSNLGKELLEVLNSLLVLARTNS